MGNKKCLKGDYKIGQRIKQIREERGMTQKEMADNVLVSPSSITRLESGQTMVSVFTMVKIAEVLNVPISFIFSECEIELETYEIKELVKRLDCCTPEQKEILLQSFARILDAFL